MKNLVSLLIVLLCSFAMATAQTDNNSPAEYQSLFSSGSDITGTFVEFTNAYTKLNHRDAFMPGITLGIVMNHNTYVGLRARSFSWNENTLYFPDIMDEGCYLTGGYGGLFIESGRKINSMMHITFPLTIGGGSVCYLSGTKYPEQDDDGEIDMEQRKLSSSNFYVVEPGINLELNMTGFMKFTAGFTYRWLLGLNLENTSHNALNDGSFNMGIKIGIF